MYQDLGAYGYTYPSRVIDYGDVGNGTSSNHASCNLGAINVVPVSASFEIILLLSKRQNCIP